MTEHERSEQQWRRAELALAVESISASYHSGQWSEGYRKGCQASRILDALEFRHGAGNPWDWPEVRSIAAAYLWKHRRAVAREW